MPAHLKRRKRVWYVVDADVVRSLGVTERPIANHLLKEYLQGKYGLRPTPTVQEYFDKWIESKIEPLFRRAQIRDYRQHFNAYILPRFKDTRLSALGTGDLIDFRVELLRKGRSVKTARNVIDSSFRALYRDARAEIEDLKGRDPFIDIQWPRVQREKPDPFTIDERDRILGFFQQHEPFYHPWVLLAFMVGTRPSEASALKPSDISIVTSEIDINKSRYLRADNNPKTQKSRRVIQIPGEVIEALLTLPSFLDANQGAERVFLNKCGDPLDANQWARDYWPRTLHHLGIRHRKFYCTRHTFITEQVKRGENLKAIADYCGTSVMMIEQDYCGTLTLNHHSDPTEINHTFINSAKLLASPTGFEPVLPA